MINLIPNEEKKRKIKDFYFRATVVFFAVLGFSVFVSCATILPAYFFSLEKKNFVNNKLEVEKKANLPEPDSKALLLKDDLIKKLSLIEKIQAEKYIVSEKIINEIILKKMSDIKISSISYQNDLVKGKSININGTAPSRERLTVFRKSLEENTSFKKVDLPVSNFVKGSNIQFFLNLTPS
ncbi:hypothetical protein HZA26_04205 [Candidatus Nomurabacteria bacterium]|nr:hypothetical protein [Candidatus Nomurabacteria bacterium]